MSGFIDTFTDSPGINLSGHTSDSGAAWSKLSGADMEINPSGQAWVLSASGNAVYRVAYTPASGEVITFRFNYLSAVYGMLMDISYCCNPSADTCYDLSYLYYPGGGVNSMIWQRYAAGTSAGSISDSSISFVDGHTYEFSIYYNTGAGTHTITGRDVTAGTLPGVLFGGALSDSTLSSGELGFRANTGVSSTTGAHATYLSSAPALTATISPSTRSGGVSTPSSAYTITLGAASPVPTSILLYDGGVGGTFAGTYVGGNTLTIPIGTTSVTFTYERTTAGTSTITPSASGVTFSPTTVSYVASFPAATSFTVSGPATISEGVATPFVFTPNGTYSGVITPSITGLAGTWSPTTLTWSSSYPGQAATFTASATGSGNINGSASPGLTAPSNLAVTSITGLPNPPANPQLDLTNPLAATLQSLVLFDSGSGLPRNLVTNTVALRWPGYGVAAPIGLNCGDDPLWLAGQFTPDHTPSHMLRWANNSKSLAWAYGGIGPANVRSSGDTDRTYFAIYSVDAVDLPGGTTTMLLGSGGSVYGDAGNSGPIDGLGIVSSGDTCSLAWIGGGGGYSSFTCVDEATGSVDQCPIVAGHSYLSMIALSNTGDHFCRFYHYDLTTGTVISPAGSQYFTGGFGTTSANVTYSNWSPTTGSGGGFADLVVMPGPGMVVRVRMVGIDNQVWDTTSGTTHNAPPAGITGAGYANIAAYMTVNPYAMLTGTPNTSGSPPTTLTAASSLAVNGHTYAYAGLTTFVAASTLSGLPSTLPYVAIGDFNITQCNNTSLTFSISMPVGCPHSIASVNLYGSTSYPASATGTPLATAASPASSVVVLSYTPPDTAPRWYTVTAVDSASNVYTYQQMPGVIRSRDTVRIFLGGNSIQTPTGSVYETMAGAVAFAQQQGFDLAFAIQDSDGAVAGEWFNPATATRSFFGTTSIATSGVLSQLDWYLSRAAQEYAATGKMVDFVNLQLIGNSPTTSASAFEAISTSILSGVGQSASFTAATKSVFFAAGPLQLAGHTLPDNANIIGAGNTAAMAAAAANPTQVYFTGTGAQKASIALAFSYSGGHPAGTIATAEGAGLISDYLAIVSTAVFPAATNVRSGTPYGSTGTNETGTLIVPPANTVLTTETYDATTVGTVVMPPASAVLASQSFGPGSGTTGTVTLPSAANVRSGSTYGASSGTTGTLAVPTASQVLSGVAIDATAGNVALPTAAEVESGVMFGPNSATTGTYAGGGSGVTLSQLETALGSGITTLATAPPTASAITTAVVAGMASAPVGSVASTVTLPNQAPSTFLNAIVGVNGWSFPQALRALVGFVMLKRSGVPASGSGGSVTFTNLTTGDLGTVTVDATGDITANGMTPPA